MTKEQAKNNNSDQTQRAHDYLLTLAKITTKFAEVERAPRYPDGHRENDAEHSFHLSLSAIELAADFYPNLDVGLVAQFCTVHDLPEVYAGDVRSFKITDEQRKQKELSELAATKRLIKELPPYTVELLKRYEKQTEPEARFVRFIDKLLPAIINITAGSVYNLKEDYNISSAEELNRLKEEHYQYIEAMFPEFKAVQLVCRLVWKTESKDEFNQK